MSRIFSLFIICTLFFSANAFASYRSDLNHVTKRASLYDPTVWDANVLWYATLFTDNFRQSFAKHHIKKNHLETTEAARFFAEQMKKQEQGTEFTVFIYTKKDYKKFSGGDDTFWKIKLELPSGAMLKPTNVEMLPITPYLQVMYPYRNRWTQAYRVVFPKVDETQKLELHIQSVIGESSLKWDIK